MYPIYGEVLDEKQFVGSAKEREGDNNYLELDKCVRWDIFGF